MGALIEKSQKNTEETKTLQGIILICTSCKKIRDNMGNWNHIEAYSIVHYQAKFTHGTCPECAKKFIWNNFNI
jgi:hypothetical protein